MEKVRWTCNQCISGKVQFSCWDTREEDDPPVKCLYSPEEYPGFLHGDFPPDRECKWEGSVIKR